MNSSLRQITSDQVHVPIIFSMPARGTFSHFAHLIVDFILPFYEFLIKNDLLNEVIAGVFTLEMEDTLHNRFGPLLPVVLEIFPKLKIEHVAHFSKPPVKLFHRAWEIDADSVDSFIAYFSRAIDIPTKKYGAILVRRGLSRDKYPGTTPWLSSGSDRRDIASGFQKLKNRIMEKRPDMLCVELEKLSFRDQFILFRNADTLIAQHGAALIHAYWMNKNNHMIELQCINNRMWPKMAPSIGKTRNHKVSIVNYPCKVENFKLCMNIGNAAKVSNLLEAKA